MRSTMRANSAVLQYTRFVRDGTSVSIFAEAVETKDPVWTEKFAHFDGWGAIQSYRARAKRELNKRVSKRGGLSVMDGLGSEMTTRLQKLEEMAAKLLATARKLAPGPNRHNALQLIARFSRPNRIGRASWLWKSDPLVVLISDGRLMSVSARQRVIARFLHSRLLVDQRDATRRHFDSI